MKAASLPSPPSRDLIWDGFGRGLPAWSNHSIFKMGNIEHLTLNIEGIMGLNPTGFYMNAVKGRGQKGETMSLEADNDSLLPRITIYGWFSRGGLQANQRKNVAGTVCILLQKAARVGIGLAFCPLFLHFGVVGAFTIYEK